MTTFDETTRIERIAMIARAMGLPIARQDDLVIWIHDKEPANWYRFNPYTNAYQSQDVQHQLKISTSIWMDGVVTADTRGVSVSSLMLRDAIADCAARWQWEKEREGK